MRGNHTVLYGFSINVFWLSVTVLFRTQFVEQLGSHGNHAMSVIGYTCSMLYVT